MKMTTWRIGTLLWLCLSLIFWFPGCRVECGEPDQEAQSSQPSQDVILEEESGDARRQHEDDENLALPWQSSSKNERQKEEQPPQATDTHSKDSELDDPPPVEVNDDLSPLETERERHLETEKLDAPAAQDQESVVLIMSSDAVYESGVEDSDSPVASISAKLLTCSWHLSASGDEEDEAHPAAPDSDSPPAECEEEANPFDRDTQRPPAVLENMSNAHTTGTKTHSDPPPSAQEGRRLDGNRSHSLNEQDVSAAVTVDTEPSVNGKDPEDIPTFDEWKRKMMEVENEKTLSAHTSTNGGSGAVKKVQKNFNNYASVECGAKILGANPEAKSTSAILKENMDLYMLNPCSNKIWFIIELCEPVQVKQLDIANFELFSSTPKDFLVSISDRYPTNKWLKLGTFHGRDERTVQSFPLDEQLYAKYVKMFTKYIKVELLSHFGSEHFCPLSLMRVFGTSMVEEYEEIAEPSERPEDPDDDLDHASGLGPGEVKYSKNLIGSAKDVILNMVNNIAVNVLGGNSEMQGNLSSQDVSAKGPDFNETTTQTPVTAPSGASDLEEASVSADPDITETAAPSPTTAAPELPATDDRVPRPPPPDQQIVIPLEPEEEEPIGSTVTLLDGDDESEGEKQHVDENEAANVDPGTLLPVFASCSCASSLQEYLQRQCLALLSKKRKCPPADKEQIAPSVHTPTWLPPAPSSARPEPEQEHSEPHPPHERQQLPGGEPESEAPQPREKTEVQSHSDSMSEPPPLEPSQTDSSSANPAIVETPRLSSEAPAVAQSSEASRDSPAVETTTEALPPLSSAVGVGPAAEDGKVAATQVKASIVFSDSIPKPDVTGESRTASPPVEPSPDPAAPFDGLPLPTEPSQPTMHPPVELEPSSSAAVVSTDLTEEVSTPAAFPPLPSTSPSPYLSDIYADPPNGTEPNGSPVHGSSQKESVFMRLNNRIKALEMNMSLSGRYLEQLSQRYRKQMEEMQKAFNKTIIKLQNTSRIAAEQDQRQTDSIQLLHGQLENVTQMVLNLSVQVSQLQNEVSDRHTYVLLCLLLGLCFGLALFANRCRISITPPHAEPQPPTANSYSYCCPERNFTSGDDCSLKRSASYPLIGSVQLVPTKGPESLHPEESQANRKKRRHELKAESLTSSRAPPPACKGAAVWNGVPVATKPASLTRRLLPPAFRDSPSSGSSEASSHSDEASFCGIAAACSRICDGLPLAETRAEKRALRRRRAKPTCAVVDFLQVPLADKSNTLSISATQDIMNMKSKQSSGTFGLKIPLSGPV
ncbi:SUN domain-containing ossification factor-like isoform X2 [Syngnathoides biaculeatus]|uniref:SUN domain-containing ossification factor-like isoform X2 n=1 Tax=Syngnathoides biaculeatus TaxID=300417 RepID=UPI002ADD7E68|nr:SUN domain-containing ossification factor-like isoform X2 [Syngnathoides biaculeatus]